MNLPDSLVVRRLASDKTHVMVVRETINGWLFGRPYKIPVGGLAACGVAITNGVIMRPGTVTKCRTCVHLTGITEQSPTSGET